MHTHTKPHTPSPWLEPDPGAAEAFEELLAKRPLPPPAEERTTLWIGLLAGRASVRAMSEDEKAFTAGRASMREVSDEINAEDYLQRYRVALAQIASMPWKRDGEYPPHVVMARIADTALREDAYFVEKILVDAARQAPAQPGGGR
jgi:hypothetical protein